MTEREQFEKWAKDHHWTCARNPYNQDQYQTESTQVAWQAWRARAELQQSADWQPISTAPRNGSWILLWWPRVTDAPFAGYYRGDRQQWFMAGMFDSWHGEGPTHWMELPEAPKS